MVVTQSVGSSSRSLVGHRRGPVATVSYVPAPPHLVPAIIWDIATVCIDQMGTRYDDLEERIANYGSVHSTRLIELMGKIKSAGGSVELCNYFWRRFEHPVSGGQVHAQAAAVYNDLMSILSRVVIAQRRRKRFALFVTNCSPNGRIPEPSRFKAYSDLLYKLDRNIVNKLIATGTTCAITKIGTDGRTLWQMLTANESADSINQALRLWRYPVSERTHLLLERMRQGVRGPPPTS
jgi:hypothetical protein